MKVTAVSLSNKHIRLEPISQEHTPGLLKIGQHAEDWQYLPRTCFQSLEDTRIWVQQALTLQTQNEHITYVIIDQSQNRIAGSTRFLNIREPHKGLEIGYTWLGIEFQRSHINTATKHCLLQHAFDDLASIRVELKTDARNTRSRNAIARIGAKQEGILRHHMIAQHGYLRDSVIFSILQDEWPTVQASLQIMLTKGSTL